MKIILASSSKQRQDIFKMIGLKYEVVTSNVDDITTIRNMKSQKQKKKHLII